MTAILRTLLTKLSSESTMSSETSENLADIANRGDLGDLAMSIEEIRDEVLGRGYRHGELIGDDVTIRTHVDRALRMLTTKYMRSCAFVANKETGDVGIVHNVSYNCTRGKTPGEAAGMVFAVAGGQYTRVTPHVQVALPNGKYTTWTIANVVPLDDEDGVLRFRSYYWEDAPQAAEVAQAAEAA